MNNIKIKLVRTPPTEESCKCCVLSHLTCGAFNCWPINHHFEFIDPETIELFQIVKYEPLKVELCQTNEGLIRSHFGLNRKGIYNDTKNVTPAE